MVKDYKRIHHLDFYEEPHDDSDGGYSDYQMSDEDGAFNRSRSSLPPGVTTTKQRNYSCETCDKAYIGRGGLARHYRLNPTHGNLPEGEGISTQDENSNSSLASSILSNSGYANQTANVSVGSQKGTKEPETTSPIIRCRKKENQLKEVLSAYDDDELIATVIPRLAKILTLWKFLLLKQGTEKQINIASLFKEFESLLHCMQKVALNCLSPVISLDALENEVIEIQSEVMAKSLGLTPGNYKVQNTEYLSSFEDFVHSQNLSFQNGTCDFLMSPPSKRKRKISSGTSAMQEALTEASLPDSLLNDVVPEVSGVELPTMHSGNLEAEIHQSDSSNLLNATLSSTDFPSALNSRILFDLASSSVPSGHLQTDIDNLTTVTSTSLSSGSLSTVVSPEALKTRGLISLRKSVQYDSSSPCEVENIHLAMQNSANDTTDMSTSNSDLQSDRVCEQELTTFGTASDHSVSAGVPSTISSTIHLFESVSSSESGTVILQMKQLSSAPHLSIPSAGISLLKSSLNCQKSLESHSDPTTVQNDFTIGQNVANCLRLDHSVPDEMHNQPAMTHCSEILCTSAIDNSSTDTEHFSVLPDVTSTDDPHEALDDGIETSSVIQQLILPDGQVIGIWSTGGDQEDKDVSNQFVQSFLPGNLIIVQNPDGSLQLPSEDVSSESLQAILAHQEDHQKDCSQV